MIRTDHNKCHYSCLVIFFINRLLINDHVIVSMDYVLINLNSNQIGTANILGRFWQFSLIADSLILLLCIYSVLVDIGFLNDFDYSHAN